MRKIILITYGNERFYSSLTQLKKMAEATPFFDKIIVYTDKDLPHNILSHNLLQDTRGGGYWLWKPYIIKKTLEEVAVDDDLVVYSDGGNEIFNDPRWNHYFKIMDSKNALVVKFRELMKYWTRKNLLEHYSHGCRNLKEMYQIASGFSIWNRKALPLVNEWYEVMYTHPEFVRDVPPEQIQNEAPYFREHRHDQAILSCIAYKYEKEYKIKIMWEESEYFCQKGQALFFARRAGAGGKNGRPHTPVSFIWRMRHKLVLAARSMRQFLYRYIF